MDTKNKYIVLGSWQPEDLEEQVSNAMADGWKPQGGVAVAIAPDRPLHICYVQALVLEGDGLELG